MRLAIAGRFMRIQAIDGSISRDASRLARKTVASRWRQESVELSRAGVSAGACWADTRRGVAALGSWRPAPVKIKTLLAAETSAPHARKQSKEIRGDRNEPGPRTPIDKMTSNQQTQIGTTTSAPRQGDERHRNLDRMIDAACDLGKKPQANHRAQPQQPIAARSLFFPFFRTSAAVSHRTSIR